MVYTMLLEKYLSLCQDGLDKLYVSMQFLRIDMVILSRYFYENVELVANMCPRCYEECIDVRIISVNRAFLQQVCKRTSQNLNMPEWLLLSRKEFEAIENFPGFSPEELQISKTNADKMQRAIDDIGDDLKHCSTSKDCFERVSSNAIGHWQLYRRRVRRACYFIRYRIYKRIRSYKDNIDKRFKNTSMKTKKTFFSVEDDVKIHPIVKGEEEKKDKIEPEMSKYFGNNRSLNNNLVFSVNRERIKFSSSHKAIDDYFEDFRFRMKNVVVCGNGVKREFSPKLSCPEELKCDELFNTKFEPVDYESEYFRVLDNSSIHISEFRLKFRPPHSWIPPRSPHNLIEERLHHDPWALLAATIFLNKTACTVARPFVFWFLTENPDPFKVLDKFPRDLEKYFCDLGLQRTRAVQMYRMSHDFLFKNWKNANELYGIGDYGESAFRMFCLGDFSVEPKDRFLRIYKAWYKKLHSKSYP